MDGTRQEKIISANIVWPNGITVDVVLNRIYWSDAWFDRIETALFDGSSRKVVLTQNVQHPFSLAVFEDRLYWSDWETQEVQACNKFNGSDHRVVVKESQLHGIHIYHPLLEANHTNPCATARCSHLCLLGYGGQSYTCSCPSRNKWHLVDDGVTCHRHFEAGNLNPAIMSPDNATEAIYGPRIDNEDGRLHEKDF